MRWLLPVLAVVALSSLAPGVDALSCEPPQDSVVGVIHVEELRSPGTAAEVPYWTTNGCGFAVDSVPAAVRADTLAFLEFDGGESQGVLKVIDLATGERHQGEVSLSTGAARLAISAPYVYALHGGYGSRILTGWPLMGDDSLPVRTLRFDPSERVVMGTSRLAALDPAVDPPRLTTLDLDAWGYRLREHPLPVAEGSSWRIFATSERWTILEERDAAVEDWEHVKGEARTWAYEHARDRLHRLQVPLAPGSDPHHGTAASVWGFAVDGDTLHYTVYDAGLPWIPTHLESLELPSGTPRVASGLDGLHAPPYVESGRIVLFQRGDAHTIPEWRDVEVRHYRATPFWQELPTPAPLVLLAALGAALGTARRRFSAA